MESEYSITENVEEIKGPNLLSRLSLYSEILSKENNIFVLFKNNSQIPLKQAKSFIKICSLNELYPEENIYFNFYETEIDTSDTPREEKKLRSKPVKKKEEKPKKENDDKTKLNSKESNEKNVDEKEEDDSLVIIVDKLKPSIVEELAKEGSLIASSYSFFKTTWKNLYYLLLIFPVIIIIGLILPILPMLGGKEFDFYQIPTFPLILLSYITGVCGCSKTKLRNKKVNFTRENSLLVLMILNIIICSLSSFFPILGKPKELFYYSSLIIELVILQVVMLLCIILTVFNAQMFNFYKTYNDKINSGILLVDMA